MIYGVEGDSLIDFYGKCEDIKCAGKVFDGLGCVTTESSNFCDLLKAKCLFDEEPVSTWNAMIKHLVRLGELKSARILFDEMPERNKVSFKTMIDGYAKAGDMVAARLLFDELPEKDLFSWSALILGYVQNGKPIEVIKVFPEMWAMNVKPDEFIMVSLMSACSQLGFLQLAKLVDSYMSGRADVAVALLDVNAMLGNMEMVDIFIEKMPKCDIISFSSVMQSAHHVHCVLAVALFERMINEEGLRPDDVAFHLILEVCAYAGLVEDGCRFFDLMTKKYSISPSPYHYECVVNLLVKSGKLNAAYELIKLTPVEPHFHSWGALLGACKLHCDTDLADEISSQLIELIRLRSADCAWDTLIEACKLHCDTELADEIRRHLIELIRPRSVDCTWDTLLEACKLHCDTNLADLIRWQLTELLRSRSVDCIWDTQHEDHSGGDPGILFTIHEEASIWFLRALHDVENEKQM